MANSYSGISVSPSVRNDLRKLKYNMSNKYDYDLSWSELLTKMREIVEQSDQDPVPEFILEDDMDEQ